MGDNLYMDDYHYRPQPKPRNFCHFITNGYGDRVSVLSTLGNRHRRVNEILNDFGLEAHATNAVLAFRSSPARSGSSRAKADCRPSMLQIDIPGTGIAFTMPLSSIGGKRRAAVFDRTVSTFQKGEESVLKDTKYELLVVIANQGYTEQIMAAARRESAGGRHRHPRKGHRHGGSGKVPRRFPRQ